MVRGDTKDIPNIETRLEVFTINNDNNSYRFRLVGSQSLYAYKFSIDKHVLTVVAADGILIEPVKTHFIIIHTGERYDFVIRGEKPRANVSNYWIRAETLEVNLKSYGTPYTSIGNVAEGILHYSQVPEHIPSSTEYEDIKMNSIPFDLKK